ncbi:MAG TPA: AAA family ATPase [Streptosporangiaceae bacterium]|nr:AAA family ATPase [Streptosporangiaceae bacterium]
MSTPTRVPRLRGRQDEITALAGAVDRLAAGRPAVVLIEGEAGIGKTRLLSEAIEMARRRGLQVACGQAAELTQSRPFGLVMAALGCSPRSADPRRAGIAGLLAAHGADGEPVTVTSDPGLRFRVVDALADLVEELAVPGPLLITADDLQWADPSSLLMLGTLAARLSVLPVALIGCLRLFPRGIDLDRLITALDAAGAQRLTPGPLGADAVTGLAADLTAAEPGPGLLAGLSGAAGNPLFVTELIGALHADDAIRTAAGHAEVAGAGEIALPPTVGEAILRRAGRLPADTLQALRAAAVLGSWFTLTDLATVTGQSAVPLSEALAAALAAGILDDAGTGLRFRHDLIREALYADLPAGVRRGLHYEAGQRLAGRGAPALQVAAHLGRGAQAGDETAVQWLTRAAREAAARSPDIAADLLEQAAGLLGPADPRADQLRAERASCLMLAGRITETVALCRKLSGPGLARPVSVSVRGCLGQALIAQGHLQEALRELDKDPAAGAGALAWAAHARLWLGDLPGATATASRATAAADAAGDDLAASVARSTTARAAESAGRPARALEVIDAAVARADESPGRAGHRHPLQLIRGHILIELDELAEARAALDAGRRVSEELGVRWPRPAYQVFLGFARMIAGDWDDAVTELEAGLALAAESGLSYARGFGRGVLAMIAFHRNDLAAADREAGAAAADLADWSPEYRVSWAAWPQALVLEARGEPEQALAALAASWDRCAASGHTLQFPAIGADLVRLALAAGDSARAAAVAAGVTEMAAAGSVPWMTGAALRCQGLVAGDAGLLEQAAAAYARGTRPLGHALACEDAGRALLAAGHGDRGRALLDQAVTTYERLGAARALARAEAVLRAAGIRRGPRGPRGRPQSGWGSLTPAEQAVAGLVAEGLSNPQIGERLFVSRRTVQTHLAHVFAKLDISARAQLAAEVARHRAG